MPWCHVDLWICGFVDSGSKCTPEPCGFVDLWIWCHGAMRLRFSEDLGSTFKTWWNWDQNMMKYHLYLDKVLQVSVQKIWFSRLLPRPVLPVRCLAREAPGASLRHLFLFQHRVPRKGGTFIAAMRNHEVWGWGSGVKVYIGIMEPWGWGWGFN